MLAPGVIVCERRGRHAARLRHGLAEQGMHVRVSETRNGKDCLAAVRSRRSSAVAIEMTRNPVAALELIDEIRRFDSSVLVTVVVDRQSEWVEPLAREFGAAYCAVDPFDIDLLVALIVRHLEQQSNRSPSPLMGEGWGGGDRPNEPAPHPNPPPRGGREFEPLSRRFCT